MNAWLEEFVAYLRYERNYSELTVISYSSSLKAFELYYKSLEEELSWAVITSDVIRSWIVSLLDGGLTPAGVCPKLSAVKSFYRFLLKRGFVATDPAYGVNAPKKNRPLPYFVREGDLDRLLDDMEFPDTYEGRRDKVIVTMLYSTGMRAAELIGLDVADVNMHESLVSVIGKRNKQRLIPMVPELHDGLTAYLAERERLLSDVAENQALFLDAGTCKRISYAKLRVLSCVCL